MGDLIHVDVVSMVFESVLCLLSYVHHLRVGDMCLEVVVCSCGSYERLITSKLIDSLSGVPLASGLIYLNTHLLIPRAYLRL